MLTDDSELFKKPSLYPLLVIDSYSIESRPETRVDMAIGALNYIDSQTGLGSHERDMLKRYTRSKLAMRLKEYFNNGHINDITPYLNAFDNIETSNNPPSVYTTMLLYLISLRYQLSIYPGIDLAYIVERLGAILDKHFNFDAPDERAIGSFDYFRKFVNFPLNRFYEHVIYFTEEDRAAYLFIVWLFSESSRSLDINTYQGNISEHFINFSIPITNHLLSQWYLFAVKFFNMAKFYEVYRYQSRTMSPEDIKEVRGYEIYREYEKFKTIVKTLPATVRLVREAVGTSTYNNIDVQALIFTSRLIREVGQKKSDLLITLRDSIKEVGGFGVPLDGFYESMFKIIKLLGMWDIRTDKVSSFTSDMSILDGILEHDNIKAFKSA